MDNTTLINKIPYSIVYIGFSGGIDSTALLIMLDKLRGSQKFKLIAVHFDHGLRPESYNDALLCKEFCEGRNIPIEIISLNIKQSQGSIKDIEATARKLRMEYWEKFAKSANSAIALAHHADDRTENFFIRAARGSNVSGLTSLREYQVINNVNYIRPLISWSRIDVINFLKKENIKHCAEDSSNDENIYTRNFFRNKILPQIYNKIQYSEGGFKQSIKALEVDANYIEEESLKKFKEIKGTPNVQIDFFNNLHIAIKIRVLRLWLNDNVGEVLLNKNFIDRFNNDIAKYAKSNSGETKLIPFSEKIFLKIKNKIISIDS